MSNEHDAPRSTIGEPRSAGSAASDALHLVHARVLDRDAGRLVLATNGGEIRLAAKAESCLLAPEPGDLVLVCLAAQGAGSHVLSVLERAQQDGERRLELGEGVQIAAKDGELAASARVLKLEGRESAQLSSRELRLEAEEAQARFKGLLFAADRVQAVASAARVVVRSLDQHVEHAMLRMGDCYRRIRGMEHTITGSKTLIVEERLSQKAKNASLDAEENLSMNANHIDLG